MYNMVPFRGHRRDNNLPQLFDDSFFTPFFRDSFFSGNAFRVDVKDKGDYYLMEAELPGVPQDKIELKVEGDVLTISANMDSERKEEKENYVFNERRVGHMQRSFSLDGIDDAKISASYKDGVLSVNLPKVNGEQVDKARNIPIE